MAVHADTSIPLWVEDFNPAFYTSLTDKEEWALDQYDPLTESVQYGTVKNYFVEMANALDGYRAESRYGSIFSLIGNIYQYYTAVMNFGESPVLVDLDVNDILTVGTFVSDTMSRPVEYYDDLTETSMGSGVYDSVKLQEDVDYIIDNASEDENFHISSVNQTISPVSQSVINKAMFEDIPVSGTPVGKQDIGVYIFETLGYKKAVDIFNVAPLQKPSYIS